jgi:hypothetical protein
MLKARMIAPLLNGLRSQINGDPLDNDAQPAYG